MKNNQEKTYRRESEIELAFPYLEKLDNRISTLRDINFIAKLKDALASSRSSKNFQASKKYSLKSHNHKKDGYHFQVKIEGIYPISKNDNPTSYLVYVNIKYQMQQKFKQFYKEFKRREDAFKYYNDLNKEFETLKRRDIMEKLFDAKLKEIRKLMWGFPFVFIVFLSITYSY